MKSIRQTGFAALGRLLRLSTAIFAVTTFAGLLSSPALIRNQWRVGQANRRISQLGKR